MGFERACGVGDLKSGEAVATVLEGRLLETVEAELSKNVLQAATS